MAESEHDFRPAARKPNRRALRGCSRGCGVPAAVLCGCGVPAAVCLGVDTNCGGDAAATTIATAAAAQRGRRQRRGAALIIAIAILTVLLAIGLTFFTVARVESVTAMNVVNTVRAEHLVDAGFAMAEYRLNRDLWDHPQSTSLDHAWRTMFNGAAFAGKNWANSAGSPAFNLEPVERKLRGAGILNSTYPLLYVRVDNSDTNEHYIEPLFRGPHTAPWLAVPRWQGNDILIYPRENDNLKLCNAAGDTFDDADVNAVLQVSPDPIAKIVRFSAANAAQYPFNTSDFWGRVPPMFGAESLWPAEQIDRWADVDTNGDGMRESIWIPLPKDVDLSGDGVDNDLDGTADGAQAGGTGQLDLDENGNPRGNFEVGAFVYRAENGTNKLVRALANVANPAATHLVLTIPLPGLRLPVDMNGDGRIDIQDYVNGSPVYVILPSEVNVPDITAPGGVQTLDINAVDTLDNDYDQFVNGFNAYVFLGDPNNTGRTATGDDRAALVKAGLAAPPDSTAARTKYANKVIKWPSVMPNITFSPNAPAWLTGAAVPPVVITLTGEPVCDIIGRAGIQVVDESSKVNMNAAGGHIYHDDLQGGGDHIQRALNQGASTFEYETRALPGMGANRAADLWGMLTGAGWVTQADGAKSDYSTLPVGQGDAPSLRPPLAAYAQDISMPGYGRVDDNMNALLLAFNGRADAGNARPDQGLWVPPLGSLAATRLDGATLTGNVGYMADKEMTGQIPGRAPYAEVADAVRKPSFAAYYGLLGMLEGIDDPSELQQAAPLRNMLAETDRADNNNDGVTDEIGEVGDRLLANNYELQKAVEKNNNRIFGPERWAWGKNILTANSDSRNVNYIDSATGPKAVNKIDPNLAPPAQLAAGLIIRGDIIPATDRGLLYGDSAKVTLTDDSIPMRFAEGLRQADTKFTGYLFSDPTKDRFDADPELQAMQTAVNIADSRDADPVRSILIMDKRVSAPYADAIPDLYGVKIPSGLNPPAEPLNERERVPQSDAFPVGDLQDFLAHGLGGFFASKRVISVDRWWQKLTNDSNPDPDVVTDREDRTISYAVAGADAVRINEMMVRPVRRVEAEALTGAAAALNSNLDPTPYPGMPAFDLQTITPASSTSQGTAWLVQSYYDSTPTPAANRLVLGDETAYRYEDTNPKNWTDPETDPVNSVNTDIVEFRIKATDGLPAGRYYLTVNVVDPVTGVMTVDDINQLEYSVKYTSSTSGQTISGDIGLIEGILGMDPPLTPAEIAEQIQLRKNYFKDYWQTVDQPEYIATRGRLLAGSAAPEGWVFCPAAEPTEKLDPATVAADYPLLDDRMGVNQYQPGNPRVLGLYFTGFNDSYFQDSVLAGTPRPDRPASRTFTVIVPPNDPTQLYDTVCIAFRLKPVAQNLVIDSVSGNTVPRKLAINFLDFSQQPDHEYVELANTTDKPIQLDGWTLEVGIPDPAGIDEDATMRDPFKSRWIIPASSNTVIAPKGYLLLGFDKYDKFQLPPVATDNLVERNGMGLASGTASPFQTYVTEPPTPVPGTAITDATRYAPFSDATASVFRRNEFTDYIDNDGDGLSSAALVYGIGVTQDLDLDTDNVAAEAKYHGVGDGTVPPFARIVQLQCRELWWESATVGTPYAVDARPISPVDLTTTQRLAELVLRGGVLPDYPEHDGHDNDGDGGFLIKDATGIQPGLLRYVRGTLDKDMVDNDLDGRIDECGREYRKADNFYENGNPFQSEGVDEGRIGLVAFAPQHRPRAYGFGSFEEGDLPLVFTPSVVAYREWLKALQGDFVGNQATMTFWSTYGPEYGFRYLETLPSGNVGNVSPNDGSSYGVNVLALNALTGLSPVLASEIATGAVSSPEWKAFVERRWNPGDNVIVTLYVGPASDRKVADRATYREQDVINRAVDDIQSSPYFVDGYRNFAYDTSGAAPYARWAGPDGDTTAARVCLDRARPQYWLPNQMGLDFYRSLERKHPLYAGDKFGTSNRWEATDGSYDDWSDSLSLFEAVENPSVAVAQRFTTLQGGVIVPAPMAGADRLFGHAVYGSPLRMNTQQRLWDNPPDLMAYLVDKGGVLPTEDPEGLTPILALDGKKRRQFVESDSVTAVGQPLPFENQAYSLRRAEVRNRPFNSVGDLLKLPMMTFNVPLNTGESGWRSANAALNTRWTPTMASPVNPVMPYWRQDTTLGGAVLATVPDKSGTGTGFAAVTTLTDINPITLTVGQARFRPIWPNPNDSALPKDFNPAVHLNWNSVQTLSGGVVVKAPHCWSPVLLFASDTTALPYPPPLPVGTLQGTTKAVRWDPPSAWNITDPIVPYLVQTAFLFDTHHNPPVFGGLQPEAVDARWPVLPVKGDEYRRAVMYVSQHDELLGENGRAEGIFSWDVNDGLENGTYIAYVATFVPRMGQSLVNADNAVIRRMLAGGTVAGLPEFENTIMPQQSETVALGNTDPFVAKICSLDPTLPHGDGDDRFDPVLALEFITDPGAADRVAPQRSVFPPDPARPLAALPHPLDWFKTTTIPDPADPAKLITVPGAAAYHADGDGMILYSGSGQVTWKARLVRVTDNYLALRVRNLGLTNQVACVTGVVLAPARHVAGKINVNTAENERILGSVNTAAKTYSFSMFNTLLGLPGVINALSTVRDPSLPEQEDFMGGNIDPETDFGWPVEGNIAMKANTGDVRREPWRAPLQYAGFAMPPAGARTNEFPENLLAPKNSSTNGGWSAASDGVAAMRLSSMIMAARPGHPDGRYYENFGALTAGFGKGGTLRSVYPLSNENQPEWRADEISRRFGHMANLITTRSDVFEILVTVQAGNAVDADGDNLIDYRGTGEFTVTAESQGRVIYERRARTDRSDEAAQ